MNKLLPIFLFFIFSCGHESMKQKQSAKTKDTVHQVRLDSAYPGHEAFNWDWKRPTEKILLSSSIAEHIKKGQEPIDTFSGDINNDNILDLILVTGIIGEDSLRFSNIDLLRELLVFAGKGNNTYQFLFFAFVGTHNNRKRPSHKPVSAEAWSSTSRSNYFPPLLACA